MGTIPEKLQAQLALTLGASEAPVPPIFATPGRLTAGVCIA